MFRKAILAFLGVKDKPEEQRVEDDYCKACRIAKKDNCEGCDKNIYKVE